MGVLAWDTIEEGQKCLNDGCNGKLENPRAENCSCHLHPPCNSCIEASCKFECTECFDLFEVERP